MNPNLQIPTNESGQTPSPPGVATADSENVVDRGPKQVIIRNLNPKVSELEIQQVFQEFGPVERVIIMRSSKTGESREYGFVYFAHSCDASNAVKKMKGFDLYGRSLRIGYANPLPPSASLPPQPGAGV